MAIIFHLLHELCNLSFLIIRYVLILSILRLVLYRIFVFLGFRSILLIFITSDSLQSFSSLTQYIPHQLSVTLVSTYPPVPPLAPIPS